MTLIDVSTINRVFLALFFILNIHHTDTYIRIRYIAVLAHMTSYLKHIYDFLCIFINKYIFMVEPLHLLPPPN
jgi:hypothetical protein